MQNKQKSHTFCHQLIPHNQLNIKFYLPNVQQNLIQKSIFAECEVLMILNKSYIVIHYKNQIYLIDQHAACEKILYMQNYEKVKLIKQSLKVKTKTIYLIPNIYKNLLLLNKQQINNLGWYFTFGMSKDAYFQIEVKRQPYVLNTTLGQSELIYYIEKMYDNEDQNWNYHVKQTVDLSEKQKQIIAEYACHKSYRFGEQISLKKAEEVIRKLSYIQAPFNCPHSRMLISYYGSVHQIGLVK